MAMTVGAMALTTATVSHAADSVNVAFFLEWATPNQIAKVEKAEDGLFVKVV